MLTPAPEGDDARDRAIATVRVVVRDGESTHDQEPVGGTCIAGPLRVPLEHCILDIGTRRA